MLTLYRISAIRVLEALQLLPCYDDDRGNHLVQERWTCPVVRPGGLPGNASAAVQEVEGGASRGWSPFTANPHVGQSSGAIQFTIDPRQDLPVFSAFSQDPVDQLDE